MSSRNLNNVQEQTRFSNAEIDTIAKFVKDRLFQPKNKKKISAFVCGADIKNSDTARSRMAKIFSEYPRYEVHYPENIFDNLLMGPKAHSLLSLENILADSVDVVIIFPESAGSLVELGAFANHERLVGKLICLPEKKFKNKKSFINYGPHRLIRSSRTGKIIPIDYNDLICPHKKYDIYREIDDAVTKIKKHHPAKTGISNILETEGFILSLIFIVDNIGNIELYKLLKSATSHDEGLCEIAVKSSLSLLISKRLITRTASGYLITNQGSMQIRNEFKRSVLDGARSELMNKLFRRNSVVIYDRMRDDAHL
ncbi:retron St85 family effector protein [Advenella sp. WQ 585]|uniref:Retron St85 family effector protein n=1 Tax=Advenella mandrilli TaxID=2800330 RepID=A0ABS1EFN8_9BURK|nr:retron St85 family effector protein [Advenella mandrilli]MBK1781590.1 retron St85 family effector protein [Advenella mandrilli]